MAFPKATPHHAAMFAGRHKWPLTALLGGAVGIAYAPIAVRFSEVGPTTTAFYRIVLALPWLWLWARRSGNLAAGNPDTTAPTSAFLLTGLLFAADLSLWHASIRLTTVANSTLFANFAPFIVSIGAWFLFQERLTRPLVTGILLSTSGAAILAGASVHLSWRNLLGDGLGLLTAMFYGGYLLSIKSLRGRHSTAVIMCRSGLFCAPALGLAALASGEKLLPTTGQGWALLLSLALVSQVLGQSLIAYALAHLSAGFSALGLLLQPVVAAALAWWLLAEPVGPQQAVGGIVILGGILIAKRAQH